MTHIIAARIQGNSKRIPIIAIPESATLVFKVLIQSEKRLFTLDVWYCPNISGSFYTNTNTMDPSMASGSFYPQSIDGGSSTHYGGTEISDQIGFQASRSNPLFSGTKLQVSALQALPCIRI